MRQFHIKIIVIVAITIISSGVIRAQDDTTDENKDGPKVENRIFDDSDTPIDEPELKNESSGDDDINTNLKVVPINENEPPELPEKTDNSDVSTPIEIKVVSDDEIITLSPDTIGEENWAALKTLVIDNNKVEKIDKKIFEKLPNLTKLSLKGNQLKNLEMETFSEATKLSELNLDKNPLELPEEAHFLTTSSLRKFSMSECNLKMIKEDTFIGMTGLEELDIGKNQINEATPITKELFEPLSNLTKLIIPLGSSELLMKEVCKTHALLQKICLDECDTADDHSCINQETNDGEPKILFNANPEEVPTEAQSSVSEITEKTVETEKIVETTEKLEEASVNLDESPVRLGAVPVSLGAVPVKLDEATEKMPESSEKLPEPPTAEEPDTKLKNDDEISDMSTNELGIVRSINVRKEGAIEPSTSDVTSQSPNGAAIGVIIGVIIIIITGIIVKKNWRKIKSKWSSDERSVPTPKTGQNIDRIRKPEEVPLKANKDIDNPV